MDSPEIDAKFLTLAMEGQTQIQMSAVEMVFVRQPTNVVVLRGTPVKIVNCRLVLERVPPIQLFVLEKELAIWQMFAHAMLTITGPIVQFLLHKENPSFSQQETQTYWASKKMEQMKKQK